MNQTVTLYDLYRKAARKLHTLERQYKADSDNDKEYAYLTYTEMNIHCGVLQGILESLETLEPDNKYEVGKRCFEIWCEESDVPKTKDGKFGFWIPVQQEPPKIGTDVLASFDDGSVKVVYYGESWPTGLGEVNAWMPLPESYKTDKEMWKTHESYLAQ